MSVCESFGTCLRCQHQNCQNRSERRCELRPNAKAEWANGVPEGGIPWPNTELKYCGHGKKVPTTLELAIKRSSAG
jgi:hypothetical protein